MPTAKETAIGMITSMAIGSGINSWIKGVPWKTSGSADNSITNTYTSTSPKPQPALDRYLASNPGNT